MFKVKTKANFSFSKLLRSLPKIIEETNQDAGKNAITSMQKTINTRGYRMNRNLTKKRIRNRKLGIYFPDHVHGSKYKTQSTTPLYQTGSLYDSMESKKDGIYMNHYGITHNDGKKDDNFPQYTMPERPFIDSGLEKTDLRSIEKSYYKKIEKNFKK